MDTLQGQITELRTKIEGLQQLNEKISEQVKNLNSQQSKKVEHDSYSLPSFVSSSATSAHSPQESDYQLTHKDI